MKWKEVTWDIYDNLESKNPLVSMVYKKYFKAFRVKWGHKGYKSKKIMILSWEQVMVANSVLHEFIDYKSIRPLGYERVSLSLYKVAAPPFHIQGTNYPLQTLIHIPSLQFMYSRSCHQRPCFCQTKKVVGDRKSLVTGMSFCCKICECGGWFNVGLVKVTFTRHWLVVIVDQSTRPLATLITLTEHTL